MVGERRWSRPAQRQHRRQERRGCLALTGREPVLRGSDGGRQEDVSQKLLLVGTRSIACDKFQGIGSRGLELLNAVRQGSGHDRTILHSNDRITLSGILDEAHGWTLGSRSAIKWIVDRYLIATDKPSGIVNDLNDWSRQVGDPRYILDLFARIVTVSVATVQIIEELPPLDLLRTGEPSDTE